MNLATLLTTLAICGVLATVPGPVRATPDCRAPAAVCDAASRDSLALVERGVPLAVQVDADDFAAVRLAAEALREDLAAVSGGTPPAGDPRTAIIAGTLGRSARIDRIVRERGIDTAGVAGVWEGYLLQVVTGQLPHMAAEDRLEAARGSKQGVPLLPAEHDVGCRGVLDQVRSTGVRYVVWVDGSEAERDRLDIGISKTNGTTTDDLSFLLKKSKKK